VVERPIRETLLTSTPSKVEILDDERVARIMFHQFVGNRSGCGPDEARQLVLKAIQPRGVLPQALALTIRSKVLHLAVEGVKDSLIASAYVDRQFV
jgi:hypothetical protein